MAQWKITPTEEKLTSEHITYKKDDMTITAEHFITSIILVVSCDTKPEITVGPDGFDYTSLYGIPNISLVSAELVNPYNYYLDFDIADESVLKTWKDFLRDENGALTLDKLHLLDAEGWTKTQSIISKCPINVEEVV